MEFEKLLDTWVDFYGVDNNAFKIDGHVFEAIEDPADGWRSYLGSVEVKDPAGLIFFPYPIAKVQITYGEHLYNRDDEHFRFTDASGHIWLEFGTDRFDSYYPSYQFTYTPGKVTML